jgi:hypothetical protein
MNNENLLKLGDEVNLNKYLSSVFEFTEYDDLIFEKIKGLLLHHDHNLWTSISLLIEASSLDVLKNTWCRLLNSKYSYLYTKRLRLISSILLKQSIIEQGEYNTYFDVCAYQNLTVNNSGDFVSISDSKKENELAKCYSRAKYGSMRDIKLLATYIVSTFQQQLEKPDSNLSKMFKIAQRNEEVIVLMVPGSRNIESASNLIFDIALKSINVYLANRGLATIINIKLPRLDPPVENYASLSSEERERISAIQDHVLPDVNFYKNRGVHVIFGDDVLITGATADKVQKEALHNGAKSFYSIYAVVIDPVLVLEEPSVEAKLNTAAIGTSLDAQALSIFVQDDLIPVMKTFNLILSKNNIHKLSEFLTLIPDHNILKIYVYAMGNGYFNNGNYKDALLIIKELLINKKRVKDSGSLI